MVEAAKAGGLLVEAAAEAKAVALALEVAMAEGDGCGGDIRVSSGDNVDGSTGGDAGGEGNVFVSVGKTKPVYRLAAAQPTTTQQEPSESIARLRCGSHRLVAVAVRCCAVLAF